MYEFWAGTEHAFEIVVKARMKASEVTAGFLDDMLASLPPLWTNEGGVATLNVKGSLVSGEAGVMRCFGVLGYEDIAAALVEAASDPDVKSILMDFNTGGGSVNGVADLSNLISRISAVKPVNAHTDNNSMSAGYWLMSAANHISLAPTAMVGSIGVLTVHTEYSQALAQDGIKKTIMRAGDFKALSNPFEPLTDEAKAQIQSQLDDLYGMFTDQVSAARGLTPSEMESAGQGREFLGKRAVNVKLADSMMTYDKKIAYVKKIDKGNTVPQNSSKSKGPAMKITLNEQQLAAIQAGASPEAVQALATVEKSPAEIAAEAAAVLAAQTAVTEAAAIVAAAAKPVAVIHDPVIAHLTTQLAAANDAVTAAKVESAGLKAAAEATPGLLAIAREAIGKMSVALGGSTAAAETLDAQAAITEHARISDIFKTKFKVGPVAVAAPAVDKPQVDPLFASAVKSAPSATK